MKTSPNKFAINRLGEDELLRHRTAGTGTAVFNALARQTVAEGPTHSCAHVGIASTLAYITHAHRKALCIDCAARQASLKPGRVHARNGVCDACRATGVDFPIEAHLSATDGRTTIIAHLCSDCASADLEANRGEVVPSA